MWELDYKESWAPKTWCLWTVVLEKTLEISLDCKEIQPVHPKGNQSCTFIRRTDAEAEAPVIWPPDVKSWLIWKDSDAGQDWGQEKGTTEDEMIEWPHRLNGDESGWFLGLVMHREVWRAAVHGVSKSRTRWATDLNWTSTPPVTSDYTGNKINPGLWNSAWTSPWWLLWPCLALLSPSSTLPWPHGPPLVPTKLQAGSLWSL